MTTSGHQLGGDITGEVEAERLLREGEEQYRSIFESVLDALFISDRGSTIVEANPAACALFGYPYDEFIGLSTRDLLHPDDLHIWDAAIASVSSGSPYTGTGRCIRKDGAVIHVEGLATPFAFRGETHYLAVVRDVSARVEAEQLLREREAQYRSIFESSVDGILIADLQGRIAEANPAACALYGYTREELIGMEGTRLMHPDSLAVMADALAAVKRGEAVDGAAAMVRKDGTIFYLQGRTTPFTFRGKLHLLSVVRDVTQQVAAEQRLREREEQYRSIFEATGEALIIADLEGVIVEVNPAACKIYGYGRDELIGMHSDQITRPEDRHKIPEAARFTSEGGVYDTRAISVRKGGTPFHVDARGVGFLYRGKPHVLGVMRDVTAQVEAEQQLREREEQYRLIFESSSDGVIINDPATGCVVHANPAVCRMHGYSYDEFVSLHPTEFIHPDYHPLFVEFVETIVGGGPYQCEALDTRKDGSAFPVEVHGSGVVYQGRPHILALVRDVTERVRARELLEQRVIERTRELNTVLEVSRSVTSTLQLEPLLDVILDQLTVVAENDVIAVLELRGDELVVLLRRAHDLGDRDFPERYATHRHGPMWEALRRGEVAIIGDIRGQEPLAAAYREAVGDALDRSLSFERSFMAVPMMLKDRIIGLLALSSSRLNNYTVRQAHLALGIAQQAAIAIENARLYERAQEGAVIEERQRLSRELHDSVSQALYSIVLGAKTARALLEQNPGAVAEPLDFVLAQAARGLAEMRALIFELRPESLAQEGLVAALAKQADALRARHLLQVETVTCEEPELSLPAKEALYRVAQEALQNVVKHAAASQVCLRLSADAEVVLEVRDDGRGFDPTAAFPGHLGLSTMRERVDRLGGALEIESAPGAGTTVRARVPCSPLS